MEEGEVLEFFAGRLGGLVREAIEHHLDNCPDCLGLIAHIAAGIAGATPDTSASFSQGGSDSWMEATTLNMPLWANLEAEEPAILSWGAIIGGRYQVRRVIGVGGMGIVYSCLDRSLDREVALKLLRYRPSTYDEVIRAEERLLREAQILAGLSHPNIVAVYDVGNDDGLVFIAMELVHGRTLEGWLEASPAPSQEAILEVFVAAGRGLAAAHTAGVVHRDLKPANVLVGDDGRVRVTDFGLALSGGGAFADARSGSEQRSEELDRRPPAGAEEPCRATSGRRGWAGTPRYMSPEQLSGAAASAASDLFGFTLALAEGLLGADPFPAATLEERLARIAAGPVLSGPSVDLSRSLRCLLRRGLAARPSERYPSMEALCDELDRIREGRAWGLWSALGLSLVAVVSLVVLRVMTPPTTCESGEQLVSGVWSPEVRERITAAVEAGGEMGAVDTWRRVEPALDRFASDWKHAYRDVCAEASDERSVRRQQALAEMACLDRAIAYLSASASLAEKGDPETLRVLQAVWKTQRPLIANCEEMPESIRLLPEDPAMQASVFALRIRLDGLWLIRQAGDMEGAERRMEALEAEAEALGYKPLLAEVLHRRGIGEHHRGELGQASATFERALDLADESELTRLLPQLWLALAHVHISRGQLDMAEWALKRSEAARPRASLAAKTRHQLSMRAHLLRALGHHHAALELDLEMRELAYDDLDKARIWVAESISRSALGEWGQALQLQRQALAMRQKELDEGHTRIGGAHNLLGGTLMALGEMQEAEEHLLRALEIREALGEGARLDLSHVLLNIGRLAQHQGDPARALRVAREAVEIREARLGGEHPEVAEAIIGVAELHLAQEDPAAAVPLLRRAHRTLDRLYGPNHPQTSLALIAYADALLGTDGGGAALDLPALDWALVVLESAEIRPDQRARARAVVERARTAAG